MHFGINSGLVIAGGIGVRGRQEYSVMGDAVNVASRLEGISEQGEVLVGPGAYRLTAPLFEFAPLESVQVKGKTEPVMVYCLLAAKAVRGKGRGIAGLTSPLVGREAELRTLQEVVERLEGGEGGIVTLVGEAGLGKSRLVAELCNSQFELDRGSLFVLRLLHRLSPVAGHTTRAAGGDGGGPAGCRPRHAAGAGAKPVPGPF